MTVANECYCVVLGMLGTGRPAEQTQELGE